jgi:tetratricopeptide (TPR) repeat protein
MSTDAPASGDVFRRAVAAYEAGKYAEAERMCIGILEGAADHFDAARLLAVVQYRLGRRKDTLTSYDRMLALRPDYAEAHNNRGVVLHDLRRAVEALASYNRALELRPDYAEALNNRGVVLQELTRLGEALASYGRASAIRPDYAEAQRNRGVVLLKLARLDEALASFDRALEIRPGYPDALYSRALVLQELQRPAEAIADLHRVIADRPQDAEALLTRSQLLCDLDRFEEALADCDAALAIRADNVDAHVNRGRILKELRRLPEALASFAAARQIAPDHVEAQVNEAVVRLLNGELIRGFQQYEWRWRRPDPRRRSFTQPQWDGLASLYNKTILLHAEGRLSDTIQFCRYAPLVAARGAEVLLQVAPPLCSLMASLSGIAKILAEGETPPAFDLHCPLDSLPFAFATKLDTIPAGTPYLRPATEAVMTWETRLAARPRPRVGIAWAGDPRHESDRRRSIEFRRFAPLIDVGTTFVRLQKEMPARDEAAFAARRDIFDPSESLGDFSDTASLISRLDLVISVDTSVAHLTGALAKPVWVLLPATPDWRWLLGRNSTAWYPTARLFRQAVAGDWDEVISRVAADLANMWARNGAAKPQQKPA